jgi:hypothetical protein
MAATIQDVRRIVMALPDVAEGVCHGTPAFYLRKKLMLRLRDDFETLVVRLPIQERDHLIKTEPHIFSVTDHYRNYPAILVSLPHVSLTRLAKLIEEDWRRLASRKQLAAFDASLAKSTRAL